MSERGDELTTEDLAGRAPESTPVEQDEPRAEALEDDNGSDVDDASSMPLFPAEEGEQLRGRWSEIQAGFVDDPRQMVERADHLVADLMQRLAAQFSEERGRLESQWDSDDEVSTEELRVTLTRYRSFFERLLEA